VVVTVLVLVLARSIFRDNSQNSPLREIALLLTVLVLFQFLLGVLTVWTGKIPSVATAHVALGSLVLGCSVMLVSFSALERGLRRAPHAKPLVAGGSAL
jgi:heme A synthase